MFFWIFCLAFGLLIPATMLTLGLFWKRRLPNFNSTAGYRTSRSTRSPEAWALAHAHISRLWLRWGISLLAVSALGFVLGSLAIVGWRPGALEGAEYADPFGYLLLAIDGVQLAVMIGCIFPVERGLKRFLGK